MKYDFFGYITQESKSREFAFGRYKRSYNLKKGKLISNISEIWNSRDYLILQKGRVIPSSDYLDLLKEKKIRDFFDRHQGNYLVFLYDKKEDELVIINNSWEACNLYYYFDKDHFVFSDKAGLIREYLKDLPTFDMKSVPTFLDTGYSSTENYYFENMYRILPGDVIYVKENKVSKKNHLRTQYCFNRKPFKNLEKHLDKYESLFRKSIKNYVDTVKPENLGIFLSGGHDSSYIFIQSSKVFKKPIHGYTVSFRKFGFDEAPKAEAICKKFGGVHHTIEIGPEHLDMIPRLTSVLEEPLSGHGFAAYVIAEESSGQVDTIFTGDPGDTLWAEYYPVAEWHKYLKYLPYLPRKAIHDISSFLIRITDWERLWELEHTLSLFSRKEMYKDFMQRLCTYRHFNDKNLRRLLAGNTFGKVMKNKCSIDIRFSKNNFSDALIESKMIYGVFVYNILMNQKPVESFGMNFYCPYLDRDIIEFINSLPLNWLNSGSTFEKLINSGTRRRFHKLALLRYLPKRFVYGLQQSFDVPWYLLFHKRQRILENLLKRLKKRGWYNPKYLDKIFREFRTQKIKPHEIIELKHHGYRIYSLLSLEIWCMEFLDSQTTDKNRPLEEYLKL